MLSTAADRLTGRLPCDARAKPRAAKKWTETYGGGLPRARTTATASSPASEPGSGGRDRHNSDRHRAAALNAQRQKEQERARVTAAEGHGLAAKVSRPRGSRPVHQGAHEVLMPGYNIHAAVAASLPEFAGHPAQGECASGSGKPVGHAGRHLTRAPTADDEERPRIAAAGNDADRLAKCAHSRTAKTRTHSPTMQPSAVHCQRPDR